MQSLSQSVMGNWFQERRAFNISLGTCPSSQCSMSYKEANCAGTHMLPLKTMRFFFFSERFVSCKYRIKCPKLHMHNYTSQLDWFQCRSHGNSLTYTLKNMLNSCVSNHTQGFPYHLLLISSLFLLSHPHFLSFCSNCPKTQKETKWCHL